MSHNGSSETSSFLDENWTAWFCNLSGNHFFCEVEKSYIEDSFNLFGLKQYLAKDYSKALDTILDRLTPMEPESEELSRSAALLYGLIHARYIITSHGLEAMKNKFMNREFGECPRALCRGQAVVPVRYTCMFCNLLVFLALSLFRPLCSPQMGLNDDPKHSPAKLFCPRCRDVYNCNASQRHIDGAYFGPTFPHIFFMSFDECVPDLAMEAYEPKVYGFRIHSSSTCIPRGLPLASRGSNGPLDSRGAHHSGRGGLGGLSEASTGAGTGYEKSGGGESTGILKGGGGGGRLVAVARGGEAVDRNRGAAIGATGGGAGGGAEGAEETPSQQLVPHGHSGVPLLVGLAGGGWDQKMRGVEREGGIGGVGGRAVGGVGGGGSSSSVEGLRIGMAGSRAGEAGRLDLEPGDDGEANGNSGDAAAGRKRARGEG